MWSKCFRIRINPDWKQELRAGATGKKWAPWRLLSPGIKITHTHTRHTHKTPERWLLFLLFSLTHWGTEKLSNLLQSSTETRIKICNSSQFPRPWWWATSLDYIHEEDILRKSTLQRTRKHLSYYKETL